MAGSDRDERLAEALRANLKKRKRQERARESSIANDGRPRRKTMERQDRQPTEGEHQDRQENGED